MSAVLATALALLALPGGFAQGQALQREWTVRRWALRPGESRGELESALDSADWRERAMALEALERSGPGLSDAWVPACLRALELDHPSVRAAALGALARRAAEVPLPDALAGALAAESLPDVRAALARLAGRGGAAPRFLEAAIADPDPRVREDAGAALFADLGGERARRALEGILRTGEPEAWMAPLEWSRRHRLLSGGDDRPPARDGLSSGARALVAALELARGEGERATVDAMLSGWYDPELGSREARTFLERSARALEPELASALLDAWLAMDRGDGGRWPAAARDRARGGDAAAEWDRDLLRVAMNAVGPDAAMVRIGRAGPTKRGALAALELAVGRVESWDREVAAGWLRSGDSKLRAACLEALGRATDGGDEVAATAMREVLESGTAEERRRAFAALCEAPDVEPHLRALYEHWAGEDEPEQLQLLRELPRTVAPVPFRDALLDLGAGGGAARGAVLDLLELFRGDDGIADAVAAWVEGDLERALATGSPSAPDAELRVSGGLRVLASVAEESRPDQVLAAAERALRASAETSERIGRVAASVLASRPEGRLRLAEWLGQDVLRRTRCEAAIGLAPTGDPRAARVLMELAQQVEWDLASRMVAALGELADPEVRDWLAERAVDGTARFTLRGAAADRLAAQASDPAVLPLLERIAAQAPDPETIVAAVRGLGRAGAAGVESLLRLRASMESGAEAPPGALGEEAHALVRLEILLALARAESFPAELDGEVLAEPLRTSGDWLERRFLGRSTARAEFAWAGELDLFGELAGRGRADEVLAASGEWWRLDGRLLVRLGLRAASSRGGESALEAADELLRAGRIALAGEALDEHESDVRARLMSIQVALARHAWLDAAERVEELVEDWSERRIPDRVWNVLVGARDRAQGVDPAARFSALSLQLRARDALEGGELERARSLAARAAGRLGFSLAAHQDQAKLEARLR